MVCSSVIHTPHASGSRVAAPRRKTGVENGVVGGYLVLGLASGLEAFSREPPCDSIGALAVRQTPETSGMAREFLSYYPLLPSRYLRDPFTISFPLLGGLIGNSLSTVLFGQRYQVHAAAEDQKALTSLAISG